MVVVVLVVVERKKGVLFWVLLALLSLWLSVLPGFSGVSLVLAACWSAMSAEIPVVGASSPLSKATTVVIMRVFLREGLPCSRFLLERNKALLGVMQTGTFTPIPFVSCRHESRFCARVPASLLEVRRSQQRGIPAAGGSRTNDTHTFIREV